MKKIQIELDPHQLATLYLALGMASGWSIKESYKDLSHDIWKLATDIKDQEEPQTAALEEKP